MKKQTYKLLYTIILLVSALYSCSSSDEKDISSSVTKESNFKHIIFYGQSLSLGWQSPQAITKRALEGNYMLGTNPNVRYSRDITTLNPLVATAWQSGGEQPIVSAVNTFSHYYRNEVNENQLFIASAGGEGGMSIEQLSKEFPDEDNLYQSTFVESLKQGKARADELDKEISCPAIVYMQGEFNYPPANKGLGMTEGTDATTNKDEYKRLLLKLKNNMQSDIMEAYGQTEKPLFFIYQVAGIYVRNKEMSINMAQLEFAEENEDVILLNPTYLTSDYGGGHLSTNGYRWYGEYIGKTLCSKLIFNKISSPIYPTKFDVQGNKVTVQFFVPTPPLIFDTWTSDYRKDNGFQIIENDTDIAITDTKIEGNKVVITCSQNLTGAIEVIYAGYKRYGAGNLRDSDPWKSYYSYYDDRSALVKERYTPLDKKGGVAIYGKIYPMQNWCVPFYMKINK
ncbi:hypothetical protein SAMN05444274_10164 [Mariniphaga anaerophila]|uniref:Sialate O-acetylesterase domain-containing protein n=1 Tax=Mariniphaga anaerophila TaxID=1484053 RepID=A0A1M4SLH2_9BACT|nr:hypothetical protein [Mariniphaga anaerophila]SHE32827.1 hypothetical protein SAMN05444274_10164 [Mariniphaga anaerophila]